MNQGPAGTILEMQIMYIPSILSVQVIYIKINLFIENYVGNIDEWKNYNNKNI